MAFKQHRTKWEEREVIDRWLEVEYDVQLYWDFSTAPHRSGEKGVRVTLTACTTPWSELPQGEYQTSEVYAIDTPYGKQEQVHRLLQSRIMHDLQITRCFGVLSSETFTSPRPHTKE